MNDTHTLKFTKVFVQKYGQLRKRNQLVDNMINRYYWDNLNDTLSSRKIDKIMLFHRSEKIIEMSVVYGFYSLIHIDSFADNMVRKSYKFIVDEWNDYIIGGVYSYNEKGERTSMKRIWGNNIVGAQVYFSSGLVDSIFTVDTNGVKYGLQHEHIKNKTNIYYSENGVKRKLNLAVEEDEVLFEKQGYYIYNLLQGYSKLQIDSNIFSYFIYWDKIYELEQIK